MYERFRAFTVLILKINRCIHRIKAQEMTEFNLKSTHVSCLYYLYREGALTAKELRDICEEDKSYISHSIKYLEENGYIVCDSAAKKRYNAPFTLTEKGAEIAARVARRIDAVIEPIGQGLSDTERATLYRCLNLICDNMESVCAQYEEPSNENRKESVL